MRPNRLGWIMLLVATWMAVASCAAGDATPSGTAGPPDISGPVIDFAGPRELDVRLVVDEGVILADGTLHPPPDARLVATVGPLVDVPASAFEQANEGCPDLVVTPPDLRATGIFMLDVYEEDVIVGQLMRLTMRRDWYHPEVGDEIHMHLLVQERGTMVGDCPFFGTPVQFDIELQRGWNFVALRIDSVDEQGLPVSMSATTDPPGPDAVWRYSGEYAAP